MVTRRELLQTAIGLGLAPMTNAVMAAEPLDAFSSSFLAVRESLGPTQVTFSNPLPKDLQGTLYRNGPARLQRGTTQYHHWFDGDGMVQSFTLDGNQMVHQGRMVRTSRYVAEEKAGRFLWPGFGTTFPDSRAVTKPDDMNVGNISVLPVEDELWALWEGGSAWILDPTSLETRGRKIFSSETDGMSFSAHPRIEPDGRIWNFGYMTGGEKLVIYDISESGVLNRAEVVEAANTNLVHDFAITQRYLIFVLMPIVFQRPATAWPYAFADQLAWNEEDGVEVLVIDKNDLQVAHRFELPAFFAFHFGNAWQDGQKIRLEVATKDPWSEINDLVRRATLGEPLVWSGTKPVAVDIVLDIVLGTANVEQLPLVNADFPGFDQRFAGEKTRYLNMMNRSPDMPDTVFGFNQLVQFDRSSGNLQKWSYGHNRIAEEHVFVPQTGKSEGIGWLVGTTYNWITERTSLNVFNASAIADGPISEAELPYHLPLGLHGKFVAS